MIGIGVDLATLSKGSLFQDFRATMPAGSTYTRTGAATGLTAAGTLTTFAADAPQRTDRGLALEPARTNYGVPSNTVGSAGALTVTANAATSPDGTANASRTEKTDATETVYTTRSTSITAQSSTIYTVAEFFKYDGDATTVSMEYNNNGNFDLSWVANLGVGAGGVTVSSESAVDADVVALGNGWYRAVATFTSGPAVTVPTNPTILGKLTGASGVSVLRYGFQLEAGAFASSYIPTTAAAITRGLPVFTEPVPAGHTRALLTYADATTTLVTGLTPGGTFDVTAAVIGASKGRFGASELVSRTWLP